MQSWGGARPWPAWDRAYRKSFRGAGFRIRLYSLEEYFDVLGGSAEALAEAAEEWGTGEFPFVGVLAVDSPAECPYENATMLSTEIAEEIVGLGPDDYFPIPPNDDEWGVKEDDAYLARCWPPDAPRRLLEFP